MRRKGGMARGERPDDVVRSVVRGVVPCGTGSSGARLHPLIPQMCSSYFATGANFTRLAPPVCPLGACLVLRLMNGRANAACPLAASWPPIDSTGLVDIGGL